MRASEPAGEILSAARELCQVGVPRLAFGSKLASRFARDDKAGKSGRGSLSMTGKRARRLGGDPLLRCLRLLLQSLDLPGVIGIMDHHHSDQFLQCDLAALLGMEGAFREVGGL